MHNHTPIEDGNVSVDTGALIAMHALSDPIREYVLRTLNELAKLPDERWPSDKVRRHWSGLPLYILNAPEELRVFFRKADGGTIAITDIVSQRHLNLYRSGNAVPEAS